MKVAIVGAAGGMASGVIKDLIKETEGVEKVTLIDINENKMQLLKDELNDDRLDVKVIDVNDRKALTKALEEVDVCANEVNIWIHPDLARDVMYSCLDAKCHYTDLGEGFGPETIKIKEEFNEKFSNNEIAAILGMGTGPGTTNILSKYCVDRLDSVEKIEACVALQNTGKESPVFVPYYDVESICAEYGDPSYQYVNGELKEMPPYGGEKDIVFPDPINKVKCYYTIHPEPAMLSHSFKNKGVKEVTWRQKRSDDIEKIITSLMSCGFGDPESLIIEGVEVVPRQFLKKLISRNVRKNQKRVIKPKEEHVILRVVVEGKKESKKYKYTIDRIGSHGTSVTQSYAVQLLAQRKIKKGVWFPEDCVDPLDYIDKMKNKGFQFNLKIEEEI